ncbi:MAG: DNRLRE domain-containing protein [Chthoniobacterales bacterium]
MDVTKPPFSADPNGSLDSTEAIQSAITTAEDAGGGVVYLPTGTYRVKPNSSNSAALTISRSGVILRGDGSTKTKIYNDAMDMREKAIVRVAPQQGSNWRTAGGASTPITSDLPGPTAVIPVANPSLFRVGEWVVVRNEITEAWIAEHHEPGWSGYGSNLGGIAYLRTIKEIDSQSNTVTIDLPTRYSLNRRDGARVAQVPEPLSGVGIEALSIGNREVPLTSGWGEGPDDYNTPGTGAYECHGSSAVHIVGLVNGWLRDVQSYQPPGNASTAHILSNGVTLEFCRSLTIRDTVFQRPQYGGGGGNGYMFRIQNSSDCLFLECEAAYSRHGFIIIGMASSGNVITGCVDRKTARYTGSSGEITSSGFGSEHHAQFSHSNLTDDCTADESLFLAVYRPFGNPPAHNLTGAHSVFWNIEGIGPTFTRAGGPSVTIGDGSEVVATQQSRYGYAIGTRGTRTGISTGNYYTAEDSTAKTAPIDHVEGIGQGETLVPSSLYRDQLERRLSSSPFAVSAGSRQVLRSAPAVGTLEAEIISTLPSLLEAPITYQWQQIAGPAVASLKNQNTARSDFDLPTFGTYRFKVTATVGSSSTTSLTDVEYRGTHVKTRMEVRGAIQDATIRNGSGHANENSGDRSFLQMKRATADEFQREIIIEFPIGDVDPAELFDAEAQLTVRDPVSSYQADARLIATEAAWVESSVSWNSRPPVLSLIETWTGNATDSIRLDVTEAIRTIRASGGERLGLRLAVVEQSDTSDVITLLAREAASDQSPRLILTLPAIPNAPTSTPPFVHSAPKISLKKAARLRRGSAKLRGLFKSDTAIRKLVIRSPRGRSKAKIVRRGKAWVAKLKLKPGRNRLSFLIVDHTGVRTTLRAIVTAR